MKTSCTFFGHHDASEAIYPMLKNTIEALITDRGVSRFMVGNNGAFDYMVYKALCELRRAYSHISVQVVLSRIPEKPPEYPIHDICIPDGIEGVPPRFAILHRNRWMVRASQIVVTYVTHSIGGAAKAEEYAKKQKKEILRLGSRGASL